MRKILSVLAKAVKSVVVLAVASAGRIARAEGRGVVERAIQDAAYEVAERYVRSVKPTWQPSSE